MTKYYPIYYTDTYGETQDGGITGTYEEAAAEAKSLLCTPVMKSPSKLMISM